MGALYRNDIGPVVKSNTSAPHGGSEPGSDEATNDTDYAYILDRPATSPSYAREA